MTSRGIRTATFVITLVLILLLISFPVTPDSPLSKNPETRSARTIIVNASGGGDYTHIQWAIDNATDGDIINVEDGVYNEDLTVNKSITLIGKGPNKTKINGKGNWYAIRLLNNGTILKGFEINNDDGNGVGISKVSNCNLENNIINTNEWRGIFIRQTNNVQLLNNSIHSGIESIYISESNGVQIINNTLDTNNNISISIYESVRTIIVNNKMIGGGLSIWGDSIRYWNSHEIDVSNTVNGKIIYYWENVTNSIVPSDSGQVILVNCTGILVNNLDSQYGIDLIASSNNEIRNNVCNGGDETGIFLSKSNNNILINNTCNYNNIGINILESSDNQVISNICKRNIWEYVNLTV